MRLRSLTVVIAALLVVGGTQKVNADVSLGVSISDGELKSFHLAVGDFYDVPQEQVHMVRGKNVGDEELAVVFFFAHKAQVNPEVILKLRLGGKSWMEIGLQYGVTADAYYVPVEKAPGPPYGKAYGHYKNRKKAQWNDIRLSDDEIVNFVNLKFVSGYYDYSPEEVMQQRGSGKSFVGISAEIEKKRTVSKAPVPESDKGKADNKSGNKKSKGKGKS
jgi:hypothetical protein